MHPLKRFLELQAKKYHIFATYCESDIPIASTFVQFLEAKGCLVYDAERDATPGKLALKEVVENGIDNSKLSLLFITKHFLTDETCCLLASVAIQKYMLSKGKHRVIPIILEPCKIPKYMKILNCVHMWKYRDGAKKNYGNTMKYRYCSETIYTYQGVVLSRLLKVLTDRPPRFKRISWKGFRTLTWSKRLAEKARIASMKENVTTKKDMKLHPFHLLRLVGVLKHCMLHCKYNHCSFACGGGEFNRFVKHIKMCRNRVVKCPNQGCLESRSKWQLENHLTVCPFTLLKCSLSHCGKRILRCRLKDHLENCKHRTIDCPNRSLGCDAHITPNDAKNHARVCLYERNNYQQCQHCGEIMFKRNFQEHLTNCISSHIFCHLCKKKIEHNHSDVCQKVKVLCSNFGCSELVERYKLLQHENICKQAIIPCPNANRGCLERKKRLFIDCHVSSCDFSLTFCDKCDKGLNRRSLQKHRRLCKERVYCSACKTAVKRHDFSTHLKTCPAIHPGRFEGASQTLSQNSSNNQEDMDSCGMTNPSATRGNFQILHGTCTSTSREVISKQGKSTENTHSGHNGESESTIRYCNIRRRHQPDKPRTSICSDDEEVISPESVLAAAALESSEEYEITKTVETNQDVPVSQCAKSRKLFTRVMSMEFPPLPVRSPKYKSLDPKLLYQDFHGHCRFH